MANQQVTPAEVLDFWFSDEVRGKWFKPDAAFDATLRDRFEAAHVDACAGRLDAWAKTPEGALARIILLDQIPRNLFRGTPRAFASDEPALAAAEAAVGAGYDKALGDEPRIFLYMPFMHAEHLDAQERGVALYRALGLQENLDYMIRHRDVIARFGRFPHRNGILGRESTAEELEFLKDLKSWF